MIVPSLIADDHTDSREGHHPVMPRPFMIGQIDPGKGFVHVLEDTTLDVLLGTLDTVKDFMEYLSRKERLITVGKLGYAASAEDLLAYYLRQFGSDGWRAFALPNGANVICIDEGLWLGYQRNPQRLAQLQADKINYLWARQIERLNKHILNGTQYETTRGYPQILLSSVLPDVS
jgi:hypothetical protein